VSNGDVSERFVVGKKFFGIGCKSACRNYKSKCDHNHASIVKSIEKGIFVTKMGGGQVNTANGDFIFEVEEGYELNNGKIGRMLRNASLIGNGPEILNSIDMVGNDIGWQPGTCGKDGQGVPVLDGQPTLRIPKITIGGK